MKHKKTAIILICLLVAAVIAGVILLSVHKKEQTPRTVKIACIGDSITEGYGLDSLSKSYPAKLQALLGEGYEVKNYGIAGRTARIGGDKPYILEDYFSESKEYMPDIVLIMLGTNDTKRINWDKEKFAKDYRYIMTSYATLPYGVQVYLLLPPPAYVEGETENLPRGSVVENELIPAIKEISDETGIPTINLFDAFGKDESLFSDGFHPNEKGTDLIAQTVYEAIQK